MLFIIKTCMSNDMLVLALSCHMTYIFKKCPSKNLKTNPSNSGLDGHAKQSSGPSLVEIEKRNATCDNIDIVF